MGFYVYTSNHLINPITRLALATLPTCIGKLHINIHRQNVGITGNPLNINSGGPRIDPWGIPHIQEDSLLKIEIYNQFNMNKVKHDPH